MTNLERIQANNAELQECLNLAKNIIGGGSGGGAELNIAYGDTAPEDTSKLWVKTSEPSGVVVSSKLHKVLKGEGTAIQLAATHEQAYIFPGAQVGDKLWMPGGYTNQYTSGIYYFDLKTETVIKSQATLPYKIYHAGLAAIGTNVYILGGCREGLSVSNLIHVLDTITMTVSTLNTTLPSIFRDSPVAIYGNKIYIFGPSTDGYRNTSNTIWCFDAETETITTLTATLPKTYIPTVAVVSGDNAFLFNGYSGGFLTDVVKFDFLTETATLLAVKVPFSSVEFTAFNYEGVILLTYGKNIYTFNTENETFTELTLQLPQDKNHSAVGMTEDAVYLLGGRDNSYNNSTAICKLMIGMAIDLPADTLQVLSTRDRNIFKLVNADKVQVEIGVDKVYKGNADGDGEQVEAALYKDNTWTNI